jgi:tetratricopeptide (TPR) repeat protein
LDVSSAESPPATEPRLREAMRSAERLADAGSYDEALDELRAVHAIAPFQLEAHILEANVLQAKGDHAAALDALDRALMLDRRLAIAYLHAAASHEARGDEAARQKALRNARTWLARFDPDEQVPAAGGATAGELLAVCERLAARGAGGRGRRP